MPPRTPPTTKPKSQLNNQGASSLSRYAIVLILGVFFGRQWTLFSVDPHGSMSATAFEEEHAHMYNLPRLQDPSSTTTIRELEASSAPNIPARTSSAAPAVPTPKDDESTDEKKPIIAQPKDAESTDESSDDNDGADETKNKQKDESSGDENDKVDETIEQQSSKLQDEDESNEKQEASAISLETMAPQLTTNSAIDTTPQMPYNSSGLEATVDISTFQAEMDRRLPLWQKEAAKEDGWQDPPSVNVYDKVVLATKVHYAGRQSLNQMICLQKAAYNYRRNYPWVIFHTIPVTAEQVAEARAVAYPGTVTFVQDSPPLEEVVGNFSKEEQEYLIERCQCCHPKDKENCCKDRKKKIDWGFWCYEQKTGWVTLSYAWQAVFRSYNIWTHPALADYKYMVWIDDDAIPTKPWLKDPLKPMVEEDLVIFYDNFPAGFCKSGGIIEKMQLAYNKTYCYIHRVHVFKGNQTGKFVVRPCKKNKKGNYVLDKFGLVHGMMHITNMDIYRKPVHMEFQRLLTQHNTHPFSREWDDQIAVTVPAAFENPDKAWDMRMHGYNMSIHHNGKLDGKQKAKKWKYTTWWKYYKDEFPVAREMCDHLVKFGG
ncbi:unnamed protein product [Cylindrotheca closterium]|uniref:Uncharacterized protein n=1 Tax=Cylindrotheca closterium TaxID=2856 RepID=A0AAD2JJF4_9STRA|nr:unnamed protein product [Cylindrotheca closterium]